MPHQLDLLTAGDLAPLQEILLQVLQNTAAAAQPADDFLTIEQVARLTNTSVSTVRKWVREGKADQRGRHLSLFTLEFSPGQVRIPRSALVAFGQGLGFEASQLRLPTVAAKKATPTPVLDSSEALRRAS